MVESDEKLTRRKYFNISEALDIEANKILKDSGINFSELVRRALKLYIKNNEQERINREVAEACQFYYDIDKEIAEEWRETEGKV